MTDKTGAWVWSQYKGVVPENRESSAATETRSPAEERVVPFRPVPGSARVTDAQKSTQRRTKYGITIGLAALAGLLFPTIAMLLIIVAGLLIASGQEPKKVDDLLTSVPGGGHVSKALAQLDSWLA